MSAKHGFAGTVFLVLLAGPLVQAQMPSDFPFPAPPKPDPSPGVTPPSALAPLPGPSVPAAPTVQPFAPDNWVYQQAPNCCGPVGGCGPIGTEIFARSGPSFIIAGQDLGHSLRTGWEVMGGGRTLFFMPDGYRAWFVDLGVSYTYNNGFPDRTFQFHGGDVTIRNLNRSALSLGLGHDWWVYGPGNVGGFWDSNFRYGLDGGGRWGTSHLDLNTFDNLSGYERVQKIYGAAYAGLHFDVEVPMGAWTFIAGIRGEWSYSFMHLLPAQSTSLHDINLLLNMGVRY